jgi:hypothetical protein
LLSAWRFPSPPAIRLSGQRVGDRFAAMLLLAFWIDKKPRGCDPVRRPAQQAAI